MRSRGRVSPPVQWVLALSLMATALRMVPAARAGILDPLAFTSLGSLNLGAGSIVINTDAVTITGALNFNGVLHDQGAFVQNGMSDYGRQVAVFDFNNINIGAGVTISLTGSRPVALLSRGNLTVTAAIVVSGASAAGSLGGAGGVGGAAGGQGDLIGSPGIGPGKGSSLGGGNYDGGGGAYGGNAGAGGVQSVAGLAYGDVLSLLQGGSSGGAARDDDFLNAGGGGGSGGGIELGSTGPITLTGGLTASGGDGAVGAYYGGGGSGGGVILHGSSVSLGAPLTAVGGSGGFAGGGGGGGRVAIAPDSLSVTQLHSLLGSISVNGGTANVSGRRGRAGVISFRPLLTSVGSGQSLTFNTMSVGQTGPLDPRINIFVRDLSVASGGSATANTAGAISSNGILTIGGTLLLGSNNQSVAVLNGSGRVQIGSGASLTIGTGNLPSLFSGTLDGGGSVIKTGTGELALTGNARMNTTLTLSGGSLIITTNANATIGSMIINSAARPITIWNNSTATFGSALVTTGVVTVASGSRAIFNSTFNTSTGISGAGSVQINDGLVAGSGAASIGFGGDVGFGPLASTHVELGGVTPGTERDFIDITGSAALNGELRVGLIGGFLPSPGETFQIMAFGSRTGDVTVLGAPGSAGLGLTKSYTATGLSVTVNPLLLGDANYDGIVNRGDLGRMALGWHTAGDWTDGNFNGDNRVDVKDLVILANQWLTVLPAAALGEALDEYGLPPIQVPEPGSLAVLLLLLCPTRRRRSDRISH